jgi:hypothetical protein
MTKEELIHKLRCDMFSDRMTIKEAYDYAWMVAKASDNQIAVMTAVQVLANTIANEIEKMGERENAEAYT